MPRLADGCLTGVHNIRGFKRDVRMHERGPLFASIIVMPDPFMHVRERPKQERPEHSDTSLNGEKALHPNYFTRKPVVHAPNSFVEVSQASHQRSNHTCVVPVTREALNWTGCPTANSTPQKSSSPSKHRDMWSSERNFIYHSCRLNSTILL